MCWQTRLCLAAGLQLEWAQGLGYTCMPCREAVEATLELCVHCTKRAEREKGNALRTC